MSAFFAHPALLALTFAVYAAAVGALFVGRNLSPGIHEDRSDRWVIGAFGLIGIVAAFVPAWTDRIGLWTIDGDGVRWFGVMFFGVGAVLRLCPVVVLGHRFGGDPARVLMTARLPPPLVARIRAEERLLHAEFGAEYEAYRARTSRLIPGVY